jgi:hypothetical protein
MARQSSLERRCDTCNRHILLSVAIHKVHIISLVPDTAQGHIKSLAADTAQGHIKSLDADTAQGHTKSLDADTAQGHTKSLDADTAQGHIKTVTSAVLTLIMRQQGWEAWQNG